MVADAAPAGAPPPPRKRAAAAAARRALLGWSRADVVRGATMLAGVAILLPVVLVPPDWGPLASLGSAICVVLYGALAPHSAGEAVLTTMVLIVIALVGGGLLSLVLVVRYAAGVAAVPDAGRAVGVAILVTLLAACIHVSRARFRPLDGLLRTLTAVFGLGAFSAFWQPVTAESFEVIWALLAYAFVGVAVGVLVATLIVPAPAGRAARRALHGVLADLAAEGAAVAELLAALPAPGGGGGGGEGQFVGIAGALEAAVLPIYRRHAALGAARVRLEGLLKLAALEVDAYRRPRKFPAAAHAEVYAHAGRGENAALQLVAAAQGGRAPPPAPALVAPLRALAAATAALAAALGDALADDAPYKCVVAAAAALEAAAEGVLAALAALAPDHSQRWYAELSLYMARQMWRAAEAAAAAVAATQPGAPGAAALHFGDGAPTGALAARPASGGCADPAELRPLASGFRRSAARLEACLEAPAAAAGDADRAPGDVVEAAPHGGRARRALFAAAERTGVRGWMLGLGVQAFFAFGIAAAICVAGSASSEKPIGFAFWVWITVTVLADISIGNCASRAWQRLLGTALGIAWCAPTLAIALAPSGESLPISAGGRAAGAVSIAAFMTVCAALQSRVAPRGQYAFAVAIFTCPLLSVSILASSGEYELSNPEPWHLLGYRAIATVIGITLDVVASLLIFRVTARDHLRSAAAATLAELAGIAAAAAGRLAAPGGHELGAVAALEARASTARARLAEVFALQGLAAAEARLVGVSPLKAEAVALLTHRFRFVGVRWLVAAQKREAAAEWAPAPEWAARVAALGAQEAAALRALRLVILRAAPLDEALRTTAALHRAAAALADAPGAAGGAQEGEIALGASLAAAGDMALMIRAAARPLLSAAAAARADETLGEWLWEPLARGGVDGGGALASLRARAAADEEAPLAA